MTSSKLTSFILSATILSLTTSCSHLFKEPQVISLKTAAIFNSHMVIQRGKPVPIWGWVTPGSKVSVEFAGQKQEAISGTNGKWQVMLSPLQTSEKERKMIISSGNETIVFKDVLVGEVWICSGQSNMKWPLKRKVTGRENAIKHANYTNLRLFNLHRTASLTPLNDCIGSWQRCTPERAAEFSAVGFFFGRKLLEELKNVPIGVILTAWGGTRAESWTPLKALSKMDEFSKQTENILKIANNFKNEKTKEEYLRNVKKWEKQVLEILKKSSSEEENWSTMSCPAKWSDTPLSNYIGTVCFKKTLTLPADWTEKNIILELGKVDDMDITLINGQLIGITDGWTIGRKYVIKPGIFKPGYNVVTVYIVNPIGEGGFYSGQMLIYPQGARSEAQPLKGDWVYRKIKLSGPMPMHPANQTTRIGPNTLGALYNAMINPITPLACRGVIWYQGESNTNNPKLYRKVFPTMVAAWRKKFNQGNIPFYYVQIAPYRYTKDNGGVKIREVQRECLKLIPNSGMVCIMDKTTVDNIHPPYKEAVGNRLAFWALSNIYGINIPYSGPLFKKAVFKNKQVIVYFDYADGLMTKREPLSGFELKDKNGHWHKAQARIINNTVLVASEEVRKPVAVRYAWKNDATATLWNKAGLPASSFRSDKW